MPKDREIRCRYAHRDDDVPDGWRIYPLSGWHDAKGYVLWGKEGEMYNDASLISDHEPKDFMVTVLDDANMAGQDLRLWDSLPKLKEYVCVTYPNAPPDLCEATANLIFKQVKP